MDGFASPLALLYRHARWLKLRSCGTAEQLIQRDLTNG